MFWVRITTNYFIEEDGLILGVLDKLRDILLVSLGAVFGSSLRFKIYTKLEELNLKKYFIILIINTFASFCLGLFVSIIPRISDLDLAYHLMLFCSIGFLGSLSTFSSFVYDLFDLFVQFKFLIALNLFLLSLASGIIALGFGFILVNQ